MKPYLFIIAGLLSLQLQSQNAFQVGEKLKYDVYYKVSFVWVDAAYVSLEVDDTTYQSKDCYKFKSLGSSKPSYDWIFRVRDYFTAFTEKDSLLPLKFFRNTSEGSYKVNNSYAFDHANQKIYANVQRNKNKAYQDTLPITPPIYDIASAMYHLRNQDFSKLKKGDPVHIRTLVDDEVFDMDVWYMGEEWVKHKNKKKYLAYKFRSKGLEGSMFDKNDHITVWVSKDEFKIPIKIEAGIIVGKVLAYLSYVDMPNEPESFMLKDF